MARHNRISGFTEDTDTITIVPALHLPDKLEMSGDAIVVFARAPLPGQVKTRIAAELGIAMATELYRCMLGDCLAMATTAVRSRGQGQVVLAYAPGDAFDPGPVSLAPLWNGLRLEQSEGDLGHRLWSCFWQLHSAGAQRVVVIGSDTPDLPGYYLEDAFFALDRSRPAAGSKTVKRPPVNDLVLGPVEDGGFYLIGSSRPLPLQLFEDIDWGGPNARIQVLANAARQEIRAFAKLSIWHDVDTVDDLKSLAQRMVENPPAPSYYGGSPAQGELTLRWLTSNDFLQ